MRITTLLAASAMLTATAAQANLVVNGDFETVTAAPNFQFGVSANAGDQNAVTGWESNTVNAYNLLFDPATAFTEAGNARGQYQGTGREFLQPGPGAGASPNGGNFVALDGDSDFDGPLTQTINGLVEGLTYELTFFWAAGQVASRTGPTTEQLMITIGDDSFLTDEVAVESAGFEGWFTETFTFTAGAASEVLSFMSIGTPNGLPPIALLDGVSIEAVDTPTPATLAVFGLGLAGLAASRLRRR